MAAAVVDVLMWILNLLKYPVIFCIVVFIFFFILVRIHVFLICKKEGIKKNPAPRKYKEPSVFKRIFIQFPYIKAYDIAHRQPDDFPYKGIIIFTGYQGDGKTSSMVQALMKMTYEYPEAFSMTNFDYVDETFRLTTWRDLIDIKNGSKGVIAGFDEFQLWLGSNSSRNFPIEMLETITQNRKNRRIILGTSQNFNLMAKTLRTQTTEVRECVCLFNCVNIVRRRRPILDSEGNVKDWKNLGWYWFVQTLELREAYDTYKTIERLSAAGFPDVKKE